MKLFVARRTAAHQVNLLLFFWLVNFSISLERATAATPTAKQTQTRTADVGQLLMFSTDLSNQIMVVVVGVAAVVVFFFRPRREPIHSINFNNDMNQRICSAT